MAKKKIPKRRSAAAVAAITHSGSGKHTDKRFRRNQKRRNYDVEDEAEMKVTFSDEVVPEVEGLLTWIVRRSHEVGIPMKEYRTAHPDVDSVALARRKILPGDLITYVFDINDDGDCFVTVGGEDT